MDKEIKFHKQTSVAVKKANQILGLIKKTMATKNEKTIPLLYMTLVRPHLEYANAIWGPFYKQDQQLVERVQRRATKMIPCLSNLSYENRIRSLNMPSLHHRLKRGDMITESRMKNYSTLGIVPPEAILSKYKSSMQNPLQEDRL